MKNHYCVELSCLAKVESRGDSCEDCKNELYISEVNTLCNILGKEEWKIKLENENQKCGYCGDSNDPDDICDKCLPKSKSKPTFNNIRGDEWEMKYFEIKDPYYALIKAENLVEATKQYIEVVAGDDEERPLIEKTFKEVSRDYALVKLSRGLGENGKVVSTEEVIQDIQSDSSSVLLIDGSLI